MSAPRDTIIYNTNLNPISAYNNNAYTSTGPQFASNVVPYGYTGTSAVPSSYTGTYTGTQLSGSAAIPIGASSHLTGGPMINQGFYPGAQSIPFSTVVNNAPVYPTRAPTINTSGPIKQTIVYDEPTHPAQVSRIVNDPIVEKVVREVED